MRVPLSWLREFVPVEAGVDQLAEKLSVSGLAVEEIIRTGEGVSGVVVGEVRAMREHPNADSLMLVKAFDGTAERDIVCGARNYAVGDRVPLALPGARLPGGVEIGKRTVRGEVSDGMMCSARELRIADDHSGILVLDSDARLGADLVKELSLDDVVFHLDVTTNRPDCLSIVGVAREVAALYRLPLTIPDVEVVEDGEPADVTVTIEDSKGCPRYLARAITGVRVGPSPWWMRRKILAAGMRPISNVVDVTNYVLLERGQPLHAFDLDLVRGGAIVVRKPRARETILTLDGIDRALVKEDVVICDAERPVAIAGVMGGAETEVSDKTTRLLLESAAFDPLRIRRTSARLRLRSEASTRFERGSDVEAVPSAASLAASLFARVAGGRVSPTVVDVYPKPRRAKPVRLRAARANRLIGVEQPIEDMARSLVALGCGVEFGKSALRVTPPSWRPDIAIEEDLIEEVARILGLENVPETLPAGARTGGLTREQRGRRLVRELLRGAGLSEAQTLSLLPPSIFDRFGLPESHPLRKAYRVSNPLSEEESVLRPTLIPGLALAAQRNVARRVLPVRLFETGTVFVPGDDGPRETMRVAWIMTGPAPTGWHAPECELDFYDGKGVLESLMEGLGVTDWRVVATDSSGIGHPGRTARVEAGGREIGLLAELHPRTAEALELPSRVVIAQLDLEPLLAAAAPSTAPEIPRLPAVARDIALIVPETVPAADVGAAIKSAGGALLESVSLFDVYRGEPVPEGSVSLAYALLLRDAERTLTDADADGVMRAIEAAATANGWAVRA